MYLGVPNPNILVPLEKMTISAEIDGEKETIEVLYNPESYSQSREVRYAQSQGIATNTPLVQYTGGGSEILQFKLFFDSMSADKHVPPLLKLKWSSLQFTGHLISCSIQFVRFSEQGMPLRAWMDCTFQEYIAPDKVGVTRPLESPDTTKYRTVHQGDSLWALSAKEYGQPEQWRAIADANRLSNPRQLRSGERLVLPALKKEP